MAKSSKVGLKKRGLKRKYEKTMDKVKKKIPKSPTLTRTGRINPLKVDRIKLNRR
jgi:hypothetical protein